jgi:hypothetical protein
MIGFESKIEVPKIEPITPCVALRPREAAKALGSANGHFGGGQTED